MERIRRLWQSDQGYEPIGNGLTEEHDHEGETRKATTFSYLEYSIFVMLGISMLWAWNMFLAAGPYFQSRFRGNSWIRDNFQAAEISVSTATNLGSMLILTRMQANASYPKRIIYSLVINMAVFALLALSTEVFLDVSAAGYFGFLMVVMFFTSLATGLCQNGIFAYVSGFGEPKYTQGIMTGQGVAGVLPCIVQIGSVLAVQADSTSPDVDDGPTVRSDAALAYFLTATMVALVSLMAFLYLNGRHRTRKEAQSPDAHAMDAGVDKKVVPFSTLFRKLRWLALAVFVTFAITMVFPVFTQEITSVKPIDQQPPLLQHASFIPLAFLFWNSGDLIGRLATAIPSLSLVHRPGIVFALSSSRVVFVGLYYLCNIRGRGAVVESDLFYLVVVQLLFGLSNGYLGSTCMIGAAEWVDDDEKEVAGSFMGLCLVCGLCAGSLLSFAVAGT